MGGVPEIVHRKALGGDPDREQEMEIQRLVLSNRVWFEATLSSLKRTFSSFSFPEGGKCDQQCKNASRRLDEIESKMTDGSVSRHYMLELFGFVSLADRLETEWDDIDEFSDFADEQSDLRKPLDF